ncbi:MAG: universal stress protein, partial [Gammaproteobacteria bacterium]|nr:universal stress protein [Gammaproteobacteria bacterium]
MANVMACIDGSRSALAVCDYAAWASQRMDAPLAFLHVLGKSDYPVPADLSGNIGLGSREHLLQELAELDEKRSRLALEQGRLMLDAAKARAVAAGVEHPASRQRHRRDSSPIPFGARSPGRRVPYGRRLSSSQYRGRGRR